MPSLVLFSEVWESILRLFKSIIFVVLGKVKKIVKINRPELKKFLPRT